MPSPCLASRKRPYGSAPHLIFIASGLESMSGLTARQSDVMDVDCGSWEQVTGRSRGAETRRHSRRK
jgi:hypothetical protein